jgi:hypothetical protein
VTRAPFAGRLVLPVASGVRTPFVETVGWPALVRTVTIDDGVGLDNEEQGGAAFVCARPRRRWAEAWMDLRHLDA